MTEEGSPERGVLPRAVVVNSAEAASDWGIAIETPVEIRLNGTAWTVMLATPADVADLAVGLALTERIIAEADAVADISVTESQGDISVNLSIPATLLGSLERQSRSLAGNSGCGLCGTESLLNLHARDAGAAPAPRDLLVIPDVVIQAAFASLPEHQPINRATRSVHAAAWCLPNGSIALVREDVGRHNALDKLVGAMARTDWLDQSGFIVMTSRCSYELVSKAARTKAALLATISAPTSLALTWSESLALPLACLGPHQSVVRFPQEALHAS